MIQPYGYLRFYNAKFKRVSEKDGRSISPAKTPILWDSNTTIPSFQLFTEEEYNTLYSFKLYCPDDSNEIDLAADFAEIEKIVCEASNKTFNAWVYRKTTLSETVADGLWYIEIIIRNASLVEDTYYSNIFLVE